MKDRKQDRNNSKYSVDRNNSKYSVGFILLLFRTRKLKQGWNRTIIVL